jgi:hypothetical protein
VIRTAATLAALIGGHTVLETARDARFLQELSPGHLAIAYAAMAVVAAFTAPIATRLVHALGRAGALTVTLVGAAIGTLGIAALPAGPVAAMALHLWTGVVATVLTVQFWLLAGELGRRAVAPIAAAGTFGASGGAALATVFASGGIAAMLAVAAALYLVAGALVRTAPDAAAVENAAASARWTPPRRDHVRRLATVVALSTAALLLADYLFKVTVASSVPDAALPAFFARYNAIVSALALLVQLGGVGWLTRGRRLVAALALLPVLVLAGALSTFALPVALLGVVVAKGADGVLRHSLHRVSLELLWMPLPARLRARARPSVDGVLVRVTQALTAGALLLVGTSPVGLAGVVATVSGLWLIAAIRATVLRS